MEIVVNFNEDGETVEGLDDDGSPISDLGKAGLDRGVGVVHERRMKRFAKLAKMAADIADKIKDGSLQLDAEKSLRAILDERGATSYVTHDAAGEVEFGPETDLDKLMALLSQPRRSLG